MHRGMFNKMVMTAIVFAVALLFLLTGCAGGTEGEELVCLTDEDAEKVPQEEFPEGQEILKAQEAEDTKAANGEEDTEDKSDTGVVYVHVCGEVANPGVYPLSAGSRLYEAIQAAGGILENGAGDQINQAAQAEDGQQIYVPSREEAALGVYGGVYEVRQGESDSGNVMKRGQAADDGRINLNTASKEQLMTLSGIGEAKAASIIAYREEHGGFQRIEELMEVEGIKEGVFNKVKDQIGVN